MSRIALAAGELTPEDLRKIWHDEAAGAKPIPTSPAELERQREQAEKEGKIH